MSNLPAKKSNIRWGDWLTALLLVIIMQIATARLVATLWTKDMGVVQVVALLGTILGIALGKSIFKRFWVVFFAFAYGLLLISWQIGLTLDPEIKWRERLVNLWGRLEVVISEIITKKPVTDNLLFLTLMALIFWFLAIYAGYVMLREGNPWKVIIPGGVAIFIIHSFDPLLVSRSWYLAFYLFFSLILVARLVYLKNTAKWKETHTHTPPDMGFDFSRVTLVLSMILVFFAWNVPVLAETFKPAAEIWQTTSKPWLTTKDRFGFMFASLRASVGLVKNFYGDTLPLGLGTPLSDQVMMEVEAPTDLPNGFRFYWEARSYTTYNDNHWSTEFRPAKNLTPDSVDINQPGLDVRPIVLTTFFPHTPISNLFVAPEPLWLNTPTQAYMEINPDGTVNFGALMSKDFVRPGEQYAVRSSIDAMTVNELKAAGNLYPQWVLDEYLQLPSDITPRTRELANNIASGLTNPYEIANTVTEYLRTNIEYNQSISQPPPNQERIDWFLFDYKKGFCNYYASAEVILLRSLGIPARMAVGFAEGERQLPPILEELPAGRGQDRRQEQLSETATYIVRQKDAHAWPEIYFPGIGWVIFEPTVSQPALFRPSGDPSANLDQNQPEQSQEEINNQLELNNIDRQNPEDNQTSVDSWTTKFWTFSNIAKLIILVFAIGILGIVVWQVRRGFKVKPFLERASIDIPQGLEKGLRRIGIRPPDFLVNWVYYHKLPALSRSYMEINHALRRLDRKPAVQDTPSERTASLINAIPATSLAAERLLTEYQTSIYSLNQADPEAARKAGFEIRKLSWLAKLRQFLARFQESEQDQKLP
jgi:transglutaminase-like putative cysteine protease